MKTHLGIADKTHVGEVDDERLVALLEHRVELNDVFRGRSLAQRERLSIDCDNRIDVARACAAIVGGVGNINRDLRMVLN